MSSRAEIVRGLVLAAALMAGLWVAADLAGPLRADIRAFDPNEVARLDNAMWRAYYDKKPLPMYFELAELLRKQFHFPFLRSHVVAANAARAAFTFKNGHSRADYEKALPDLVRYYRAIRDISTTPFDVQRTARLELEWWIVHRERLRLPTGELERALASAAAELYRVQPAALDGYARDRADAMVIRDTKAVSGGVHESDWRRIENELRSSWQSLWKAIQPTGVRQASR